MEWSPQQSAIFDFFSEGQGNLVVRARAGTGKTTTILKGLDFADDKRILLAAFNKRIAGELAKRLSNPRAEAKTLHALGFGLVKQNWPDANLDVKLKFDEKRSRVLVRETGAAPKPMATLLCKLFDLARQIVPFAKTADELIEVAYNFDIIPGDEYEPYGWNVPKLCERVCQMMELAKQPTTVIDFTDMLFLPVVNGWATPRYDLVCVDEAQDMNYCQLELAQRVLKKSGRLVVVGDDRQAIYGFRGADSNSIDRLCAELDASELPLSTTYRCPVKVVEAAQKIVEDYTAAPNAPEGIVRSINIRRIAQQVKAGDFVLSRTNAALTKTCLELIRNDIPAKIQGKDVGRRLDTIVKDISKKDDRLELDIFLNWLQDWSNKERSKAVKAERDAYAELISDQQETLEVLCENQTTVADLRHRIGALFGEIAEERGLVICSTVHKAKGLESATVFILEQTLYPYKGAEDCLEEKNIEYVAVTRAMQELVWVQGKL
jgi:DNA helicase-2/ATP-dependent DNA helicase PcrA